MLALDILFLLTIEETMRIFGLGRLLNKDSVLVFNPKCLERFSSVMKTDEVPFIKDYLR